MLKCSKISPEKVKYIIDEKKYGCFYSYFFSSIYKTLFFFEHFEHKTIFP